MAQTGRLEPDSETAYFHLAGTPLGVGSVILPGNWGRIISKAGWRHNLAIREMALEAVRVERFPSQPSRFECAFAFVEEREAQWFRKTVDGFQLHHLFRVRLQDNEAISFIADVLNLPPKVPFVPHWPDRYWMGVAADANTGAPIEKSVCEGGDLCAELLTLSPLVVDERLD